MENTGWEKIDHVGQGCFGCGPDNPHGLRMSFETNGEKLRSLVVIPDHLRGWHNIVHGGILSTICDEIMAWSAIHFLRRFILTKTIKTRFLKPVTTKSTITAIGYVKEYKGRNSALMAGEIYDEDKKLCAVSTGEFALFTSEAFRKLKIIPDEIVDEMAAML